MEKSEFKKLQYFDITIASKHMIINLFESSQSHTGTKGMPANQFRTDWRGNLVMHHTEF